MSNNPESAQFQISYNAAAFARAIGRNCSQEWAPNLIWEVIQLRDKALATMKYTGSLKKTKSAMLTDMDSHWMELGSKAADELEPVLCVNMDNHDQFGTPVDTRGYPVVTNRGN